MNNKTVLLFDQDCHHCNIFIHFVARNDISDIFIFSALNSEFSKEYHLLHNKELGGKDSLITITNFETEDEEIHLYADSIVKVLLEMPTNWRILGKFINLFPEFLTTFVFRVIASTRYKFYQDPNYNYNTDVVLKGKLIN